MRPYRPITPGEILKYELDSRGWNEEILAAIINRSVQYVKDIINADKRITD